MDEFALPDPRRFRGPRTRTPTEKQITSPARHPILDLDVPIPQSGHRIPPDCGLPFGGRLDAKMRLTEWGPRVADAEQLKRETIQHSTERMRLEFLAAMIANAVRVPVPAQQLPVETPANVEKPVEVKQEPAPPRTPVRKWWLCEHR